MSGTLLVKLLKHTTESPLGLRDVWTRLVCFVQVTGKHADTGVQIARSIDPTPLLTDEDDWAMKKQYLPAEFDRSAGTSFKIGHVVRHDGNEGFLWETFTIDENQLVYNSVHRFDKTGKPLKGIGSGYFNAFGLGWQEDKKAGMPLELMAEFEESGDWPRWNRIEAPEALGKRESKGEEEGGGGKRKQART